MWTGRRTAGRDLRRRPFFVEVVFELGCGVAGSLPVVAAAAERRLPRLRHIQVELPVEAEFGFKLGEALGVVEAKLEGERASRPTGSGGLARGRARARKVLQELHPKVHLLGLFLILELALSRLLGEEIG